MKTDSQITTIATNTLLNYFSDCEAETPAQKQHCMMLLNEAMQPFITLCNEHEQGRSSSNSVTARNALAKINKILFPLVVNDQPNKH
ncbi:MAG: hypothetical protein JKY55_17300 [Aliivibrio sp.]|uniref:hypothetical protein n=1 Tax=Aliivibrio sp. TaxID=1872443 RepID=UPI001A4BF4E0|nr:hypothetical protein [Aliivibrio sp.]